MKKISLILLATASFGLKASDKDPEICELEKSIKVREEIFNFFTADVAVMVASVSSSDKTTPGYREFEGSIWNLNKHMTESKNFLVQDKTKLAKLKSERELFLLKHKHCTNCKKTEAELSSSSRLRACLGSCRENHKTYYCGTSCQRQDRREHTRQTKCHKLAE